MVDNYSKQWESMQLAFLTRGTLVLISAEPAEPLVWAASGWPILCGAPPNHAAMIQDDESFIVG